MSRSASGNVRLELILATGGARSLRGLDVGQHEFDGIAHERIQAPAGIAARSRRHGAMGDARRLADRDHQPLRRYGEGISFAREVHGAARLAWWARQGTTAHLLDLASNTRVAFMVAPSGEQYEFAAGGYRAVVTESGAALRLLEHNGRKLLDGFDESEMAYGGRGQLLMPWPNRIEDGAYTFDGQDLQLALTEPKRHNASHGLVRWAAWTLEEHSPNSVSLVYRVMAQTGYPWTVDLHVLYDLSADGLTVTQTATNLADEPAPYACGAHPYFTVGAGPVDNWELTLPAAVRVLADDDRLIPTGTEDVEGTEFDFRVSRPIRGCEFNSAFTSLTRDDSGRATVVLQSEERALAVWVDERIDWLMVYTADDVPSSARRSLAVEPMTAPPNAFNSGVGLVTLAQAGAAGDELSVSWGVRSLG